jgi:hypothetical protein
MILTLIAKFRIGIVSISAFTHRRLALGLLLVRKNDLGESLRSRWQVALIIKYLAI